MRTITNENEKRDLMFRIIASLTYLILWWLALIAVIVLMVVGVLHGQTGWLTLLSVLVFGTRVDIHLLTGKVNKL